VIVYCDTSAWVKRYVQEEGSDAVAAALLASSTVGVSRITWVETLSAFARRAREQPQASAVLNAARQQLGQDWPNCLVMEVSQPVVELAGDYAEAFALRAYDALQLATAQVLQRAAGEPVQFVCFDQRLSKAALVLGMQGLVAV
jgi:uncharacterized protein